METITLPEYPVLRPELETIAFCHDFNNLSLGEELVLNINYSAEKLHQKFSEKFDNQFSWTVLENGPDCWRISIVKTGLDTTTAGDILVRKPGAFKILRKYNIDISSHGNMLLADLCKDAGIFIERILKEIDESECDSECCLRVSEWPLDFLIEYIIMDHHRFLQQRMKDLFVQLRNLQNQEYEIDPLIFEINLIIINLHDALKKHIKEEEQIIFPAIKMLIQDGLPLQNLPYDTLKATITNFQKENTPISAGLSVIRHLTRNYIVSDHQKPGFKSMFKILDEFERDLFFHLHLENNILFPKATFLEEEAYIWND